MATRQEVQVRKARLKKALRDRCRNGDLRSGDLAPSKRQLVDEFEVSATVVGQVMQELIAENLFYTVPRSGTYVGSPRPLTRERYVWLCGDEPHLIRAGFEDAIARLGGAVLALGPDQVEACKLARSFPTAAGVVEWGDAYTSAEWQRQFGTVPARACYSTLKKEGDNRDSVAFDDEDGGRQATSHLLHLRHRSIAFLSLHQEVATPDGPEWSRLRAKGWRTALEAAGLYDADLMVYATRTTGSNSAPDHVEVARDGARLLARRPGIDAVVAANDRAAQALLEELRSARIPPHRWPAIVSFDADSYLQSESLTSLRLPWEEVGKTLAELLWQRSHGECSSSPQHRLVRMRLIPRLTCQPNWTGYGNDSPLVESLVPAGSPSSLSSGF